MSNMVNNEAEDMAEIQRIWREDYGQSPEQLQNGYNKAARAMAEMHVWCRTKEDRAIYKRRWSTRLNMIKTLALIHGINLEPIDGDDEEEDDV